MTGTLSVQLYSVRDALTADRPGALSRLFELGYRHVEPLPLGFWNTPADQIVVNAHELRVDLDAAGLSVSTAHTAIPAGGQEALVEVCRILDTDTAVVTIPFLVEGFDDKAFADREGIAAFANRLNEVARELDGHGIRLAYHNHMVEWTVLPDGGLGYDVLWELLDPVVAAEFDVYWATASGQDPAEILTRLGDRTVAVHLKNGPGGPDDPMQPNTQTPLGSGAVDMPSVVCAAADVRWHITEIDRFEGDPFDLLATNRKWLLDQGVTAS